MSKTEFKKCFQNCIYKVGIELHYTWPSSLSPPPLPRIERQQLTVRLIKNAVMRSAQGTAHLDVIEI
jgi:hypothetical protein